MNSTRRRALDVHTLTSYHAEPTAVTKHTIAPPALPIVSSPTPPAPKITAIAAQRMPQLMRNPLSRPPGRGAADAALRPNALPCSPPLPEPGIPGAGDIEPIAAMLPSLRHDREHSRLTADTERF